jgi:hypothetical protein
MRAFDRGLPETEPGFGFCLQWNGAASGAADSKVSFAGRWGKQVFEPRETSAERFDERLDPSRSSHGNRTMRKVTRTRGSFKAGGAMIVHDVQGPIVTGVLGGE